MNALTDKLKRRNGRAPAIWPSVSLASASLVIILSAANLAGWLSRPERLTSWISGVVPMKTPEALTLLVIGFTVILVMVLSLRRRDERERGLRREREREAEIVRVSEELRDLNRELEARVKLRTRELETANRELESFSYAVSHDLRAPLRAIEGFSRMVIERHSGELSEQGRHYLDRVRVNTDRMGEIIDGLLVLSRLSRGELRFEKVDLSGIAHEVAEDLQAVDADRDVRVEIDPGMFVHGDRRLLRSLLQNLISNAWKFTGGRESGVIRIGSQRHDGDQAFFVRDNGTGFNPQHADKLFQPFQRLHSAEEFDGTGLGLATVRRVVNRHGGRAWAEAEVGKGATFWFSLPAPEAERLTQPEKIADRGSHEQKPHTATDVQDKQYERELE